MQSYMKWKRYSRKCNLSSSYTTVINFKVFKIKVCMFSLFSIKMSSNALEKKVAVVRVEMKPMETEQLQLVLQSPSGRSEDTW